LGEALGQPRPIISLERPLTPEEEKIKLAMEEIQKALQEHPNDVADLVRMWMQEECGKANMAEKKKISKAAILMIALEGSSSQDYAAAQGRGCGKTSSGNIFCHGLG